MEELKSEFKYKGDHHANGVLIHCIDFRFHEETKEWAKKIGLKSFDLLTVPGAAKALVNLETAESLLKTIKDICVGLHHVKKIVLVNHADCGAYGGRKAFSSLEEEKQVHERDLQQAGRILKKNFPKAEIILAYADLSADEEWLELAQAV